MNKLLWIKRISFVLVSALAVTTFIKMNGSIDSFINRVKNENAMYTFMKVERSKQEKQELYQAIVKAAEMKQEKPENARIDRVYHAIPGYNGLVVDVEETYKRNVNLPRGETIHYVLKEVEPDIQLEDLGSHPIYKGNPNKKMVSLMVNVAWGTPYLEDMLKTLQEHNIQLTFFLDGMWLKNNKELAQQMVLSGHELGNHAYSHPNMSTLSRYEQGKQIEKTNALLQEIGVEPKWFAPPSGDFNMTTVQVAKEQNMFTVLWTVDTIDWRKPPASIIIDRVQKKLEPGTLVLMHPTEPTAKALPELIRIIEEKGYQIGTVSDTLSSKREKDVVERLLLF